MASQDQGKVDEAEVSAEAQAIIERFKLQRHPEGGWYARTYESQLQLPVDTLPAGRFSGPRPVATMIYFLLTQGSVSHLHRIASDETWHHYAGGPLVVLEVRPAPALAGTAQSGDQVPCSVTATALGGPTQRVSALDSACPVHEHSAAGSARDAHVNASPQHVVRSGAWFGAFLPENSPYAFVGCTVSPGFHFDEFTLATDAELQKRLLAALGSEATDSLGDSSVSVVGTQAAAAVRRILPGIQSK